MNCPAAPKSKVLIVEDDYIQREALARLLNRLGWDTVTADDEYQAMAAARHRGPFALAIVDFRLRYSTGGAVIGGLLQMKILPPNRIILLTGYLEDLDCEGLERSGVHVFSKTDSPVVIENFLEKVRADQ